MESAQSDMEILFVNKACKYGLGIKPQHELTTDEQALTQDQLLNSQMFEILDFEERKKANNPQIIM